MKTALIVFCAACASVAASAEGVRDAMRGPALKDVRLGGYASEKMNALFEASSIDFRGRWIPS